LKITASTARTLSVRKSLGQVVGIAIASVPPGGLMHQRSSRLLAPSVNERCDAPGTDAPSDGWFLGRFIRHQDQTAFEALVQRHGSLVRRVCRRVLPDAHDADDAFQATFLVLLQKAASIAQPELLGNWLYGVAYRIALKARTNAARRKAYERRAPAMPFVDPLREITARELRSVLDAQMSHLPEKYRAPLVLCYLEGKTNEEAARLLGWPTGSISGRLARARELLRVRMSRLANESEC
jgi:RNA polymerase sigma factor (sigma-70 family)